MSTRGIALLLAVGTFLAACTTGTNETRPDDVTTTTTVPSEAPSTTGSTAVTTTPAETTTTAGTSADEPLRLISHDSFAFGVTEETFAAFTAETGIEVEVFPAGDTGAMVNQAILAGDEPLGDVLFGVDDTFLSRALDADLFEPYESPLLADVPDALELDSEHRVTPIDFGDVCVNYELSQFGEVEPPVSLNDLVNPAYRGKLVVQSPATSSPGLAFLLATIAEYGEDGWQDYWRRLVDNDVQVVSDWDTAYYSAFTRYGGDRPMVVSYASSPPAEVIFSETPLDTAPTGVMTDGCYRQIEFAGVLAGTDRSADAAALIDFMLSPTFQETVPLTWFVFPANETVALPEEFVEHTVIPDAPASVDPATIEANRERWIEEWTGIVIP